MKALIVEDDQATIEAVSLVFKLRWSEMEIVSTTTGAKASHLVETELPDVVILDLTLPDIDGIEVLKEIRHHSNVPVIVLTGRIEPISTVEGLELGADDYITKPFDPVVLLARVKNAMRHTPQLKGAEPRTFGDLTIDLVQGEIAQGEQITKLTSNERAILSLLVSNEGKMVSHNTLIKEVWGGNYNASDSLRKYIQYLRQKLGDDMDSPRIIISEWGRGYRFIPPNNS
jgi:DNA-binding response OmpR family regulator